MGGEHGKHNFRKEKVFHILVFFKKFGELSLNYERAKRTKLSRHFYFLTDRPGGNKSLLPPQEGLTLGGGVSGSKLELRSRVFTQTPER